MSVHPTEDGPSAARLAVNDDHHCFGCGRLNPFGLKLVFYVNADQSVWTPWTPTRESEGYTGMAHGGIISTVLDEAMGWAVSSRGIWAVTGRMSVAFRKPVEIGSPTRATGRIVADNRRTLELAAEIRRAGDGLLLADSRATFVRVPPERAAEWQGRYLGGT